MPNAIATMLLKGTLKSLFRRNYTCFISTRIHHRNLLPHKFSLCICITVEYDMMQLEIQRDIYTQKFGKRHRLATHFNTHTHRRPNVMNPQPYFKCDGNSVFSSYVCVWSLDTLSSLVVTNMLHILINNLERNYFVDGTTQHTSQYDILHRFSLWVL